MILSLFTAPENADAKAAVVDAANAAGSAPPPPSAGSIPLPPLETEHSWAMPTQASTFAESTDNLYWFIAALDALFFVLIILSLIHI